MEGWCMIVDVGGVLHLHLLLYCLYQQKTFFLTTVAAIKNGNENTFQEVFYSYHHKLYAFVLSKTQSTFIAEEVTQLAFIKLW